MTKNKKSVEINKGELKVIVSNFVSRTVVTRGGTLLAVTREEKRPIDEHTRTFQRIHEARSYAYKMIGEAKAFSGINPNKILVEIIQNGVVIWNRTIN